MKRIPKLRFKEFSDEWEEKKLGEISEIIMGQSPDSKNYNEKNIGLPLIQGNADCKNRKVYPRLYTSEITKESIPNDIIMTVRAPVGAIAFSNIHSCIGRGVCAIRNTNNFIYHYLIKLENSWEKISQGSTFTAVNSNDIKKLQLILPNIQEQEKIANFLSSVDKKISLTEEKLELFREYKKGVMQKIFSQELRFKDSEGNDYPEWEEKKLEEILESGNKERVENTKNYQKITIKLNLKGIEKNFSEREMADTRPFYIRELDEIIIGKQNYFNGSIAIITREFAGCICSNAIMSFKVKKDNVKFIYSYLSQRDYMRKRAFLANGTGQKELSEREFLNFIIKLPILEEQQKIANFLSSIDSKIESIEKELEGLKEFKKGLLQQMFV